MFKQNKLYKGVFSMLLASLFAACGNRDVNEYKCQETKVVAEFPVNISLDKGRLLKVNPYGSVDFIGIDSLVVFKIDNGDYLWKVVNLNNPAEECHLFGRGHGENEFSNLPVSERAIVTDSALYCDFYAPEKKTFYRCNLTMSFQKRAPYFEDKKEIKSSDNFQTLYKLPEGDFFAVMRVANHGFRRGIWKEGDFSECKGLGNINEMTVKEDINTLASVKCMSPSSEKVVEAMIRMHQINLYSVSGNNSLTLSVDGELQDVKTIDEASRRSLKKGFGNVTSYPDYFMAVYINASLGDFFKGTSGNSQLLVFDWNGIPLAKITVPHTVANAYIYDGKLFVLTANDEFYQYDAPQTLNKK